MKKPVKSDPPKDTEFQKVVNHFLKTPPRPHKEPAKAKKAAKKTRKK